MERSFRSESKYFIFPFEDEILEAQAVCCGRNCRLCETPAAYAWRKRDIDLSFLIEEAIKKELSEIERYIVEEYFFNAKKLVTAAEEKGISAAAATKALERALGKLRNALSYVIEYQHGTSEAQILHAAVRRAAVIAGARRNAGTTPQERLVRLRLRENLSRENVEKGTGIPLSRLNLLESGEKEPTGTELLKLSDFYGVSIDGIMKGEENG